MSADASSLGRLPGGRRGKQGLDAEQVAADQRRRILLAVVDVVADQGYADTAVADVIARAGVSRATFYAQFADKRACFLSAFDLASDRVLAPLAATGAVREPAALRALVVRYLDALLANPAAARVLLVDINAAGAEGLRRRAASQQRFAADLARVVGARGAERRFACSAFVAAVGALVSAALAEHDGRAGVRALTEPLGTLAVRMLLRPTSR